MKKYYFLLLCLALIIITGCCSNETFVIKEINLELVKCPAGSFMMGSPEKEKYEGIDAEELHLVTITKQFYIGKYEVTQSQYVTLMEKNPSKFVGANYPVEMVSYDDANAFCDKLNLKYLNLLPQGYKFALPTEAQWEYACRAGTNTALNSGKNLTNKEGECPNLDEVAWYRENSNKTTHPVGQKKPNAWGIYDMHGNVREWCKDWWGEYPKVDVADPTGAYSGSYRVSRGGNCYYSPYGCRSAYRDSHEPSYRNDGDGFRIVLVPVD